MKQLLLILLPLIILSCTKEQATKAPLEIPFGTIVNQAEGELRSEVSSTLEMNRYLIRVNDSVVVYSTQTPDHEKLVVGSIIIGNPDKHSQYGFLRKITNRIDTEHEIVLATVNAGLGDAFKHLNIDVRYNNNGTSILRDPGEINLTEFSPIIIPLGNLGNGAAINVPSFGFTGGGVFRVTSNEVTGKIEEVTFGIEDFSYQLQLDTRLELVASSDKATKEFILPVQFPMAVVVGLYVVTIVARVKLSPSVEPKARGILDFTQNIKPGPFNMVAKIKPFASTLDEAFKTDISGNIPPQLSDLNYNFKINDLLGEIKSDYSMPLTLEISPYGAFGLASAGLELNLISYEFAAKTETDNGILLARVTSGIKSGAKFFINSDFLGKLMNGANLDEVVDFVPPYELEVYDVTLSEEEDIYYFPCSKNYTLVRVDNECIGEELEFKFRVNATDPGTNGYKVTLGSEEIGIYNYNQLHTIVRPANQVSNVAEFIIKDEETFGCLVSRTVINKCQVTVACEPNSEFTDARDGEKYCYVISNGVKVLSKNLNYSGAGVCYENQLDNCLILGRMYSFEEAQTACPAGWKLPSIQDFRKILNVSTNSFSPIIGESTKVNNGLNFLPGGEYHPWASNTKQFAASLIDNDTKKKYLYWTSDEKFGSVFNSNSIGADLGGVAFDVSGGVPVVSPQNTGYPCRCIKQ